MTEFDTSMKNSCPLYSFLIKYAHSNVIPFHMPGHKMGKGLLEEFLSNISRIDITEIPGSDNLHYPEGVINEAQQLAAKAFGADLTFFLVNGSTAGILAAVNAVCPKGGKILAARDCHRSFINAAIIAGIEPVFLLPRINEEFNISTFIDSCELEEVLRKDSSIQAVFVTRPSYYGICGDIERVIETAHRYNKPVIVDEAHGAHLRFGRNFPRSSVEMGADITIQSAHKTLPALTQAAYLHVNTGRIDVTGLRAALSMFQSTSPSYILMASLDIARAVMEIQGERKLALLIEYIHEARRHLGNNRFIKELGPVKIPECDTDPTRLVFNMAPAGITGFETERILRSKYGVQVEMSDLFNIVCIATISDTRQDIGYLYKSLDEVVQKHVRPVKADFLCKPPGILPEKAAGIKEAWLADYKAVDVEESVGKVCHDIITPYPPGIPLLCPGETITEEIVRYITEVLDAGGKVNGIAPGGKINVLA